MVIDKIYETSKENGNRMASLKENDRRDFSKRMLSAIINIDPGAKQQRIYGFGGALTESSAYVLSLLDSKKRESIINAYFKENGYTIGRSHLNSCDFSLGNWTVLNENGIFDTKRSDKYILPLLLDSNKATDNKLKIMISPWSPPAFMKTNGDMNHGGKLKKEFYEDWAKLYSAYFKHLKDNGLNLWACSVQNETEAVQVWDSCLYSAEEETEFIDGYLYPELEKAGFKDIKILVWDHNRDGLYRRLSGSLKASKGHISGAAYHWYSGPDYENVKKCREEYPSMDLIFSEGSIEGGPRKNQYFPAERYGHNIINDLNSGCNAWIDWNIVLDDKGGPNHVGNYCDAPVLVSDNGDITYNPSFYYIGHFSRFIKEKARVLNTSIDSWMTPQTVDGRIADYMEATSAINEDGSIVLVVMNRTEADMLFTINLSGKKEKAIGYTATMKKEDKVYCCPPRSMQTYIFK